jgi:hypothetical protein
MICFFLHSTKVNLDFVPWQSVSCVTPFDFYTKLVAITLIPPCLLGMYVNVPCFGFAPALSCPALLCSAALPLPSILSFALRSQEKRRLLLSLLIKHTYISCHLCGKQELCYCYSCYQYGYMIDMI